MIEEIEVDGRTYEISTLKISPYVTRYEFKDDDGEWKGLSVRISEDLKEDLKTIHGLDAEEEISKILTKEIALEISRNNNG